MRGNLPWVTSLPLCVPADTGVHVSAVSRGLLQNNAAASMIVHAADGTFLAGGNFVLTRCGRDGQNHTNKTMQLVTGRMARRAYGSIHRKRPVLGGTGRLRRTPARPHRGQREASQAPEARSSTGSPVSGAGWCQVGPLKFCCLGTSLTSP